MPDSHLNLQGWGIPYDVDVNEKLYKVGVVWLEREAAAGNLS